MSEDLMKEILQEFRKDTSYWRNKNEKYRNRYGGLIGVIETMVKIDGYTVKESFNILRKKDE